MSVQKSEDLLTVVISTELSPSPNSQELFINQEQQDEEASDCPLLTPSPPPIQTDKTPQLTPIFNVLEGASLEMISTPTLENINTEDGLNFMNIVNSSSKPLNDEPSSRDPMVESTSSGSSSDTNEPVCAQLLTQLNTAYQHLAPDAQALFYNQDNGGKPPLVGIQLVVPKPPKDYHFMKWNWSLIRKTCYWTLMSILIGCTALVVGIIATMPKKCDPPVEWWQGSTFYEIFPASFQDTASFRTTKGVGIGDLRGIIMRLDYLKELGVRTIRLNSIFPALDYPEYYSKISNITDVNENLGTLEDFSALVREIQKRNMSIVLDLPLYPFVKSLSNQATPIAKVNGTELIRDRRDAAKNRIIIPQLSILSSSVETIRDVLSFRPSSLKKARREISSSNHSNQQKDPISEAIKFWQLKGVNGFYLQGLEHYVNEDTFVSSLIYWKSLLYPNNIFICHMKVLKNISIATRNSILSRINLLDVTLHLTNSTKDIKSQIEQVTKGIVFDKPAYPWIHWSVGGVDTSRVASTINVKNASVAASLLSMMLPGTPSIFYGDEIGIEDCECQDHKDLVHVHNLVPMYWEKKDSPGSSFSFSEIPTWLPEAGKPMETSLTGTIKEMTRLRAETTPIYVKSVLREGQIKANCDIRYVEDEMIVIERWYPRRNSYVFVANFGNETRMKDLSFLYYGGHVVVGPAYRLSRDVYFKELIVPPGEAFVIKLDK
ncbi:alpha-amylase 3 isoform X1 [Camponotus floridanus]|uniref:alpha-amylase 3 isoform X1 n=2 Tax=Camponotus floridanus TaxID=104421 RepID=UPI000DC66EF1|nr:alpha-amylase 3 isoform X1 [Camponotus floridanus]XP_011260740.2 alpha-amylase 3 isoform X1 [Camponotus floridanus]XP_011260741.2 alpha-amylase 3 isoform X1 [Camponotus floridanus]XP_011260742.2 alpha-amylase 3 isoform X1 [Camponotus floridanus]XP_011260743.2 alpha-amylase 3 isoform X1 [Camponotus floridanus]